MKKNNSFLAGVSFSLGLFSVFTGIGLINGVLVDLAHEFDTSIAAIGQVSTMAAISWAVFAFLIGPYSDTIGHKNMVVIGLIIFVAALVMFGFSNSYLLLIISGMLTGLSGAFTGPNVLTSVGDYFPDHVVGVMLAIVTISTPIANLVGVPALIYISGVLGWRYSFFTLALLSLLCTIPLLFVESPGPFEYRNKTGKVNYLENFVHVFKNSMFSIVIAANTLLQIVYWLIATYFAAFLVFHYSINSGQLAVFLSVMAVGQLIGTIAGGPLADTYDRLVVGLLFSFLLGVSGFLFAIVTQNVTLTVFLGALIMGNYAIGRPAFFALMLSASQTKKGTIMGIQATSNHIGRALGAAIGGLILSVSTYAMLGVVSLIFGLLTTFLYLVVIKNSKKAEGS